MYTEFFVLLSAVVASSLAYPSLVYSPLAPVPPAVIPAVLKSQYHAQDELGQYSYGYTDGVSAKAEAKSFDGVTRGGYSYLDSNGIVQNVNYVSDAAGFRVAASNLPVAPVPPPAPLPVAPLPVADTPEVAAAKAAHLSALNEAEATAAPEVPATPEAEPEVPATEAPAPAPAAVEPAPAPVEAKATPASAPLPSVVPAAVSIPAATPYVFAPAPAAPVVAAPIVPAPAPIVPAPAPIVPAPAPVVYSAPIPAPIVAGPLTSQYHSQDELGQYSYGYIGGPSSKAEVRTFDGVTRGGYSYVDSHGLIQSTNYVSDPVHGFRVAATNLPQPAVPVAIPDSPEVAEAKAKHFALSAKAAAEAAEKPE